jgi:hypothetical protein
MAPICIGSLAGINKNKMEPDTIKDQNIMLKWPLLSVNQPPVKLPNTEPMPYKLMIKPAVLKEK